MGDNKIINYLCLPIIQEYVALEGNRSNLVHTAWAMMGLIHAGQVSSWFKNLVLSILCHAFLAYSDVKIAFVIG